MKRLLLCAVPLLIAACATQPCDGKSGACVAVTIASEVEGVDQLVFHVDRPHIEAGTYPAQAAGALSFPMELALVFPPATAQVDVTVNGFAAGPLRGSARASVEIPSGGRANLSLTLEPLAAADGGADMTDDLPAIEGGTAPDLYGLDLTPASDLSSPLFINSATLVVPSTDALVAADFDGNGAVDIALSSQGGGIVAWNQGGGSFMGSLGLNGSFNATSMSAVDLNGDGSPDLVATNAGNQGVTYLEAGGQSFQVPQPFSFPGTGNSSYVVTGDFDGDGHGDIAAPVYSGAPILQVFLSPSSPLATNGGAYALPTDCGQASAGGDLDGDGRRDVVMLCGGSSNSLKIMFHTTSNTAGALFTSGTQISLNSTGISIAVADLNDDGYQDIIVSSDSLLVFAGNGTTTPNAAVGSSGALPSTSIAVADFDGDGEKDIAVVDRNHDSVVIMKNMGGLSFSPWHTIPVGHGPCAIVAADFDGDGKADFATANADGGTASVMLNRSH